MDPSTFASPLLIMAYGRLHTYIRPVGELMALAIMGNPRTRSLSTARAQRHNELLRFSWVPVLP